jgi:hypothetical protein
MVAQFYAAFKQRYVIGWVPESEAEQLKANGSEFWTFKDADVKVGQFDETDLTRYLKSKDSALGDMAAIAQVPAQSLGVERHLEHLRGDVGGARGRQGAQVRRDRHVVR